MATPAERAQVYLANALLPAALPTPPKSKMMLLLPTPCAVILPMSPPKASRADAEERWDARKNADKSPSNSKPGRADAVERWDAHKIKPGGSPASSSSSSSSGARRTLDGKSSITSVPGRASSCERWDSNMKMSVTSSSSPSSISPSSRASSSSARWERDSNKRAISRGSSSAERWDAFKKPRPPQADGDGLDDGEISSTGSNDVELDKPQPPPQQQRALYVGPGFIASPEPSMIPMPSFLVRVA